MTNLTNYWTIKLGKTPWRWAEYRIKTTLTVTPQNSKIQELRSSGTLRITDVSGQTIGPIFRVKNPKESLWSQYGLYMEKSVRVEGGTDKYSRNVGKKLPLLAA
jgi:hypothetical protein